MLVRRVKLRIRGSTPSTHRISKRVRGNILHRALSFVRTREDLDRIETLVKKAILLEGEKPRAWDLHELAQDIREAIEMEEAKPFFGPKAEVYCETPILLPTDFEGDERMVIPDRLLISANKVLVVDYKSEEPSDAKILKRYENQVKRYAEVAKAAFGKEHAEGYLLFLTPKPKVERVV